MGYSRVAGQSDKKSHVSRADPIYKEEQSHITDRFHNLESSAIARFRAGVRNKSTGLVLRCDNSPGGQEPHNWLYLLVDKRNVADIPAHSANAPIWGDELDA